MEARKNAPVSELDKLCTISIYSFTDMNVEGTFSNGVYGDDHVFRNLMSLLLLIEDCMNVVSYPKPMIKLRKMDSEDKAEFKSKSYLDGSGVDVPDDQIPQAWQETSPLATIKLKVVSRAMSGWQGEAQCVETGKNIKFKSDIEFIMYMVEQAKAVQA